MEDQLVSLVDTADTLPRASLMDSLMILERNGITRVAKVKGCGPVSLTLSVRGMKTMTKVPRKSRLVPVTVYVEEGLLEDLESNF